MATSVVRQNTFVRDREAARHALGYYDKPEGSAEREVIDLQLDRARSHARSVGGSVGPQAWNAAYLAVKAERVGSEGNPTVALQIARGEVAAKNLRNGLRNPDSVHAALGDLHGLGDTDFNLEVLRGNAKVRITEQETGQVGLLDKVLGRGNAVEQIPPQGGKLLPDLKTPWEFGLHVPGPADAIERSLEAQSQAETLSQTLRAENQAAAANNPSLASSRKFAEQAHAAIETHSQKRSGLALSPEAEDFRAALSDRFAFSDDPKVQRRLTEFSHMADERLHLAGKSPAEIENLAEQVIAEQARTGDKYRGSFSRALEAVAGDRIPSSPAEEAAAETLGVTPNEALDRFNEIANAHEVSAMGNDAAAARAYGVEQAKQELIGIGASPDVAEAMAALSNRKWEEDKRVAELGVTPQQVRDADAFDQRFGANIGEFIRRDQTGHRSDVSNAVLLDRAEVLRDQAESPSSVSDLDATQSEILDTQNALSVAANSGSVENSATLYDVADGIDPEGYRQAEAEHAEDAREFLHEQARQEDYVPQRIQDETAERRFFEAADLAADEAADIDPEALRILNKDTEADLRQDLARKAELYRDSLGAERDSSLGVTVDKFARDVREGKQAIDMTQWFAPQNGLSPESSERLAGQTHEAVINGMKPLIEEAGTLGIQVDTGDAKIAQTLHVKEALPAPKQGFGF